MLKSVYCRKTNRIRTWVLLLLPAVPFIALIWRPDDVGPWIKIAFAYPKDIAWLSAYDVFLLLPFFINGAFRINRLWVRVILYGFVDVSATLVYAFSPNTNRWAIALILPAIILIPEQLRIITARRRLAPGSRFERTR
jgi:hypothetical protein